METTKSTPITALTETTARLRLLDLFLLSKKDNAEFNSRKLTYSTLSTSLSEDILPLVPKTKLDDVIYDTNLPLNSKREDMAYSNNSITKFYDDTLVKVLNLNNVKLDKVTTTKLNVASQVTFNDMIQCPTASGTNGKDVVNVEYLNNHTKKNPPYIIDFGTNGNYWYKLYSNGWLELGGYSTTDAVQLPKKYRDNNYTVVTTRDVIKCGGDRLGSANIEGKSQYAFDTIRACSNHYGFWWETKGIAQGY